MSEREYVRQLNITVDAVFAEWDGTVEGFAEAAGLGRTTVFNLRNRITRRPQLRTVLLLARAVGMEMHFTRLHLTRRAS